MTFRTLWKKKARPYRAVLLKSLLLGTVFLPAAANAADLELNGDYKDVNLTGDKVTVSGGTYGNVSITATGKGIVNDGTFDRSRLKFADGEIKNGSFYHNEDDAGTAAVSVGSGIISGGSFSGSERKYTLGTSGYDATGGLISVTAKEITGGAFENAIISASKLSGGTFDDVRLVNSDAGDMTVSSGTFSGRLTWTQNGNVILSDQASFESVEWWERLDVKEWTLTAGSDTTALTLTAGNNFHNLRAQSVKTSRPLDLAKTNLYTNALTGAVIAGADTLVGTFSHIYNSYAYGDKILYEIGGRNGVAAAANKSTAFTDAVLTMNDNARAGSGFYTESLSSDTYGSVKDNDMRDTAFKDMDSHYADHDKAFAERRDKITDADIAASVDIILTELKTVDGSTKNYGDLSNSVNDALTMAGGAVAGTDWKSAIVQQWNGGRSIEELIGWSDLAQKLTEIYQKYNAALNAQTGDVEFVRSSITLNGTAALVNAGYASGALIFTDSGVTVNGVNEFYARSGRIVMTDSTLNVAGVLNVTSGAGKGKLEMRGGTLSLSGTVAGDIASDNALISFENSTARIDGSVSGTVNLRFSDNFSWADIPFSTGAAVKNVTIDGGKVLNIAKTPVTAEKITGGVIAAKLTDAIKTQTLISAAGDGVTLRLNMSQAPRDAAGLYHITSQTGGFTLDKYSTSRFAISGTPFTPALAESIPYLTGWTGGDLYIQVLASASEATITDLEKAGLSVTDTQKEAAKVLDTDSDILDAMNPAYANTIESINDLLDEHPENHMVTRQILRETAPDENGSTLRTAQSTARAVLNVATSRFDGFNGYNRYFRDSHYFGGSRNRYRGRSGGDYTSGQISVWAQGMADYAKLSAAEGFRSRSAGFAVGAEGNLSDAAKIGAGYANTSTDIHSPRSKTDVSTDTGFVYGIFKPYKAYVHAVAAMGWSGFDDKTKFVGLQSKYKTRTFSAQAAAGYDFGILSPEAALRYTNVRQNAFTDALGARMKAKTTGTLTGVGTLKFSRDYRLRDNLTTGLTPELKVSGTYDFTRGDEERTVLLPDNSSYVVKGSPLNRFGIEAGAGLSMSLGNKVEFSLSYEGRFKAHFMDHGGLLNVKVNF